MSNLEICFNAVAPIFLLIAYGYLAKMLGVIKREQVASINKIVFACFLSVTLFYNIYSSDLSASFSVPLLVYGLFALAAEILLGFLYTARFVPDRSRKGVMIQAFFRSNTAVLGLPLARSLYPDADLGSFSILMAVLIPLYNILGVVLMEMYRGEQLDLRDTLKSIAKNPLIIGSLLGVFCSLLKVKFPYVIEKALSNAAGVSSPLLLFLLGAFFDVKTTAEHRRELIAGTLARLLVCPGILLTLAALLGFRNVEFVALLSVLTSSAAVATFSVAQQMGGDADLSGNLIVTTGALCSFTIFLWSFIFKSLGIF